MKKLVGCAVFVRGVNNYYTGRLVAIRDGFLELESAAWIADAGRFSEALSHGNLVEVEPYVGTAFISIASVCDVCVWDHPLPREAKP